MSEEAKTPKRGVGTVIRERLAAGDTNDMALEAVKAEFPDSSTSVQTVSWYRNQMRKDGNPQKVPTAAEAKKAHAPAAPAEAEAAPAEAPAGDPLD